MKRSTTSLRASRGLINALVETEVGLLPETWPVQRLGDVFETQLGKMLSQKAHGGEAPKPYLRNKNVQWGSIDTSDMLEMDFSEREKAKFQLCPGDLLVCEGGVPGRAAIWNGAIKECYYQKALHRLRPRNGGMVNQFMLHWLRFAFDLQNLYGVSGASSTIAHLPEAQLKALPIPVPPLPEQRKIADVLGLVQRAMEQQEGLITLTMEVKKALLHQLFTHGLRAEAQKQTEIGLVPQSWEVETLADAAITFDYGTSVKCEHGTTGVPVLRIPNVVIGSIDLSDLKYGQPKRSELDQLQLQDGDLLFVRTNGVLENAGRCALFRGELKNCYFASYLMRVRVDSTKVLPAFVNEYARTERGRSFLSGRAIRTADGKFNINSGTLKRVMLPLPSVAEQTEIVDELNLAERKLSLHERKHAALTALFRTLLHQLMTAQIRVHDLDRPNFSSSQRARSDQIL